MLKKALLLSLFLLLNGCSLNSLSPLGEVDKVQVVSKNASVSHYRAYFVRTRLKPIKDNQKYLYFYNKKKKDLAILLHKNNHYILYSLFHPEAAKITIRAHKNTRFTAIEKVLEKQGYHLSSPQDAGATSFVALRLYKGIKTLLVEVKDYSALQIKYQQAIKNYNAASIHHIKTKLPHSLISGYYDRYYKQAKSDEARLQLKIIAKKLQLDSLEEIQSNEEAKAALAKEIPEEPEEPKAPKEQEEPQVSTLSFNHYAKKASYDELDIYLAESTTKSTLSFNQYAQLEQRHTALKEENLLNEGSLEELISAYKVTKKPSYKKRILELMKEVQK
ncbi:MAG: hypothetical protein COB07_02740 [Sulfurovum sp.]|nr:MAG: hypothetical protein COB07_02740 [Sulfurovum sp.]